MSIIVKTIKKTTKIRDSYVVLSTNSDKLLSDNLYPSNLFNTDYFKDILDNYKLIESMRIFSDLNTTSDRILEKINFKDILEKFELNNIAYINKENEKELRNYKLDSEFSVDISYGNISRFPYFTGDKLSRRIQLLNSSNEYRSKENLINNVLSRIYDAEYADGLFLQKNPDLLSNEIIVNDINKIPHSNIIKILNLKNNLEFYINFRGILVPYRKIETSKNSDGSKNYLYIFPEKMLNNPTILKLIMKENIVVRNPSDETINLSGVRFFCQNIYMKSESDPYNEYQSSFLNLM